MRRRYGRSASALAIWLLSGVSTMVAAEIASCVVSIERLSSERARVDLSCRLERPLAAGSSLTSRLILFQGQSVSFEAATVDGVPARLRTRFDPHSAAVALDGPVTDRIRIRYLAETASNLRLPLLVPLEPLLGQVRLEVSGSDGGRPAAGAFPPFDGQTPATATLSNFAGFVFLPWEAPSGGATLVTVGRLTDTALVLLIALASLYWWRLRQKALAETEAAPE